MTNFNLVLDGKQGSSLLRFFTRFEFLEKSSAKGFAWSDADDKTSEPMNKGGKSDLLLLRTLFAIRQKSRKPSFEKR